MKYCSLLIIVIFSLHLKAQTFEGTIGDYPIFLELNIDYDDDRASALYFYKSHLQNVSLEGNYKNSKLILFERFSNADENKELFTLTLNNNKLTGNWKNNGSNLTVNLTQTEKDIEAYKLEKLEFIRDSITSYNTKELVWFTEKYSKKTHFRLGNGFTKLERDFINPKLDTIHSENALVGLDCGWADFNIEINLVSNHYLSFTESSSTYCGGAHPNHAILGYNFDIKNKIVLNDLKDLYPHLDHYKLLKNKYKNDTNFISDCDYFTDNYQRFEYYSWVLTKNGVIITPSFPHAMTPCEVGFKLTYKELQE